MPKRNRGPGRRRRLLAAAKDAATAKTELLRKQLNLTFYNAYRCVHCAAAAAARAIGREELYFDCKVGWRFLTEKTTMPTNVLAVLELISNRAEQLRECWTTHCNEMSCNEALTAIIAAIDANEERSINANRERFTKNWHMFF